MKIVSISGLDGSGKSTQIEMLKTYLESQGKKVFYFHAVQFSIANKRNLQLTTDNKQQGPRSVTKASWIKIQLRKIALVIDLVRFKFFTKNLEKQGCDYLLSDRYFYDNLINISFLEFQNGNTRYKIQDTKYIQKPDFAFYLNTDPQNIMQRDRVPDQGLEYLNKKKELLDTFSRKENLIVLDGNKNKEEIFEEIKNTVISNQ